jgi:hypothetical protein
MSYRSIILLVVATLNLLWQQGWLGAVGVGEPSGPRTVVVLYETENVTPAFSQELVLLRTGANESYRAEKGHRILALDDDSKGPDGQPTPIVAKLNAENVAPPAVFVLAGEKVLAKQTIRNQDGAAAEIMGVLRGAGG